MTRAFVLILAGLICASASAGIAGGYAASVTDMTSLPVIAAPNSERNDTGDYPGRWAGGYGGMSMGYSYGGNDWLGLRFYEGDTLGFSLNDVTNLRVRGATADLRAGYRWQKGNWVFGPELDFEKGSVDELFSVESPNTFPFEGEPAIDVTRFKSTVKSIVTLAVKAGYVISPDTLIYGTAGYVRGDFEYLLGQNNMDLIENYTASGYVLGLGLERNVSKRVSVFTEWQYRNFGRTEVGFSRNDEYFLRTFATPEHYSVKVGLNFSF